MSASRLILLSGFEPFGGSDRNPSAELAALLAGAEIGPFRIETLILPGITVAAGDRIEEAIARLDPEFVIATGEDSSASAIRVERVAVNRRDFSAPDNAGALCRGLPVVEGGPDSLATLLPTARLVAASLSRGVPAEPSDSAGTYLCNEVKYRLLHRLRSEPTRRGGFIHVPRLPAQVRGSRGGTPMPIERTLEGLRAMIEALAEADDAPESLA
ncbi:MAG: pyroglutamyl-peptidase I [Phycisphaerales bacterium]